MIEKPVNEKVQKDVVPQEGIEITEIIAETSIEQLPEKKLKPEESKVSEVEEEKTEITQIEMEKIPKKKNQLQQLSQKTKKRS